MSALIAAALAFLTMGPAMAQERIRISSKWGNVSAELADNDATRSLVQMLPITIEMQDHLRQEKTGNLPSSLPEVPRQRDFAVGTLGLWGPDHFVIYYRKAIGAGAVALWHDRTPQHLWKLDQSRFPLGPVREQVNRIRLDFITRRDSLVTRGIISLSCD
jgi:hypothetical protein